MTHRTRLCTDSVCALPPGADACILVYSCENRQSYTSLERWFHSFVDKCPLLDGEERTFPFVCVGNKHDLVRSSDTANLVDEDEVKALLGRLLPALGSSDTVKKEPPPSAVPSAFPSCHAMTHSRRS